MLSLTAYIRHPELLDQQAVDELRQLVERHPTYQAARLLLLRGLYRLQDDTFGAELRRAALSVPDRTKLFEAIEGNRFSPSVEERHPRRRQGTAAAVQDRTQTLIDSFLSQLPEEPRSRRSRTVDASVDYMSYLLQHEDAQPEEDTRPAAAQQPVAPEPAPVAETTRQQSDDTWPEEDETEGEGATSEACFTETLARIYIKQGKYVKAIEIIRRLSLNYPKKNRYFADQIRFLEKLIINERSKTAEK